MTILTRIYRFLGAALAAAVIVGPAIRATAREQAPPAEKTTAPAGDPSKLPVVPEAEKKRTNPVPDVPEAIESGKALYASQCAMCHGGNGDGRGDLAVSMKWKIMPFNTVDWQGKRTDGELFYIMSQGHGDMPAEKRLVDQNKWEIVRYVRTLGPAAAPAAPKGPTQ